MIERPEACVHKMIQFVHDKLISIDELEHAADLEPAWPNLSTMCEELSECCLGFAQDSDLIAAVVQICLQHRLASRKQVGIRFLRASLGNDVRFFGRIVAKVLWDMPIVSKHVSNTSTQQDTVNILTFSFLFFQALITKLKEIISNESQANQIEIRKEIAEDVVGRRYMLRAATNGNRADAVVKNPNESLRLAVNLIRDFANSSGNSIDIKSIGSDGVLRLVRVDPGGAVAKLSRLRR